MVQDIVDEITDEIADSASLEYVAEGAANVLYASNDPRYTRYLVRLRKRVQAQPSTVSVMEFMRQSITPLFKKDMVVEMRLVKVGNGVVKQLNSRLNELDRSGDRDRKRQGTTLDENEAYGILVESMTSTSDRPRVRIKGTSSLVTVDPDKVAVMLEFKPKWLVQSRDAPANWKYCRTCALRRMRSSSSEFCPLDLVSGSRARVEKSVRCLVPDSIVTLEGVDVLRRVTTEFVLNTKLFATLASVQTEMDRTGVFAATIDDRILIAMTARDCTAFLRIATCTPDDMIKRLLEGTTYIEVRGNTYVRVDTDNYFTVVCRLADLDIKDRTGTKLAYWQSIERALNDGGWYTMGDDNPCRL
ncbi:inositol-pentakisphosphate 2-kinase [Lipomyces arxii]|uniref:inositol-pentakisphosphate 2-kinase n=1 Tax=Lipomyces arxii TaxID=56418 RepID=UPI0034CD477C